MKSKHLIVTATAALVLTLAGAAAAESAAQKAAEDLKK
jgi:hypothetical protein